MTPIEKLAAAAKEIAERIIERQREQRERTAAMVAALLKKDE